MIGFLWFDTDSVIFTFCPDPRGKWEPPIGNILGDWDNQLDDGEFHIIHFVSCDPKVYSYETNTERTEMKVKGTTQNSFTGNIINWDQVTNALRRTGRRLDF